jgi:hypothetical protein
LHTVQLRSVYATISPFLFSLQIKRNPLLRHQANFWQGSVAGPIESNQLSNL